MKKVLWFIPAIVFTLLYGFLGIGNIGSLHPMVFVILILFWTSGILLCKGVFWGGFLGFIPGAIFIYLGTQDTGQIIKETPAGIIIVLYYALCAYWVYRKTRTKN